MSNKNRFLILILILLSTSSWAKLLITPIHDGEFNMDMSACWLESSKQEIILYSIDSNEAKLKINGKLTTFTNTMSSANKSQLICGKNYQYKSTETLSNLKIFINPKQSKDCIAKITLSSNKTIQTIRNLKLKCSE